MKFNRDSGRHLSPLRARASVSPVDGPIAPWDRRRRRRLDHIALSATGQRDLSARRGLSSVLGPPLWPAFLRIALPVGLWRGRRLLDSTLFDSLIDRNVELVKSTPNRKGAVPNSRELQRAESREFRVSRLANCSGGEAIRNRYNHQPTGDEESSTRETTRPSSTRPNPAKTTKRMTDHER